MSRSSKKAKKKKEKKADKESRRREKAIRKAALGLGPLAAPSTPMGIHSIYQDHAGRRGSEVGSATESEYVLPGPIVGGGMDLSQATALGGLQRGVSDGSYYHAMAAAGGGVPGLGSPPMSPGFVHSHSSVQAHASPVLSGALAAANATHAGASGVAMLSPSQVRAIMRLPEADRERALALLEDGERRAREHEAAEEERARQLAILHAQQAARQQQAAQDAAALSELLARAGAP